MRGVGSGEVQSVVVVGSANGFDAEVGKWEWK